MNPDTTLQHSIKGIYNVLLTQTSENVPTVTVLQNTLGYDPIWTRLGDGEYKITGDFPTAKTTFQLTNNAASDGYWKQPENVSNTEIIIRTRAGSTLFDGLLLNTPFTITVFN
jgi:hypothetical protein